MEDDPYGELYFEQAPPPSMLSLSDDIAGSRDYLAHCGSLSKVLSPGLRVGWMIANPELLARATMCKQFSDAHTSNLTQATAAEYLQMNRMDAAMARVRPTYAERARVMGTALKKALGSGIEFVAPEGGMFIWARLTAPAADARIFAKTAIDRGVAFVPGTPFFATAPDHATLRLSFATADVTKIEEGIGRLAAS